MENTEYETKTSKKAIVAVGRMGHGKSSFCKLLVPEK